MRNINQVQLSGTIFFSKLNDKQSYSILNIGLKLGNGGSCFASVNNPTVNDYEAIKAGNKIIISSGVLDTWDKEDGTHDLQIKANDPAVQFFSKEKVIPDYNKVSIIGKVVDYTGEEATIEMIGERNPKTDKPTVRKARIKVGNTLGDLNGKLIMLEGTITPVDIAGKTKLVATASYDKICIL